MTKEEAIEGIKRHAEAILNLAKMIDTDDYLSIGIVNGHVMMNNRYYDTHSEDGLGFNLSYLDGKWYDA